MNKSKYLALITAVSIMSVGVGYAAWSQSFTVTHEVSMGHLKVNVEELAEATKISKAVIGGVTYKLINECDPKLSTYNINQYLGAGYVPTGLPYFSCNLSVPENKEGLTVTLNDVYPGIYLEGQAFLVNAGSIPIKFEDVQINVYADQNDLASKEALEKGYVQIVRITPPPTTQLDVESNTTIKYGITISDNLPDSFEKQSLKFHFTFAANQNTK